MPAYEYVCKDCGKEFTVYISLREFEAHPLIKCPQCGSKKAERKYSGFFAKTSKKS
jgi:putative FmdB family regulatory protein